MCAYDEAVSARMTLGTCFNVVKPLDTETINVLRMRALQHRSIKNHKSETEDEEQDALDANVYSDNLGRFTWSSELHEKFLQAVEVLGASATAGKIHQYMNAKDLNLTRQHVASHLQVGDGFSLSATVVLPVHQYAAYESFYQLMCSLTYSDWVKGKNKKHMYMDVLYLHQYLVKHRLRAQRLSQGYQHYASMKELSEMISSSYKLASAKPNNYLATTQTQFTHGVASSIWDKYPGIVWPHVEGSSAASAMWYKYPGKPWGQVGESSARAEVSQINAGPPSVLIHGTKSIWDRYEESLQYYNGSPANKCEVLPVKSKTLDVYGCNIFINLERGETSRTEAAGKIVIGLESDDMHEGSMENVHAAVTPQKDTMEKVRAAVTPQKDAMDEVHAAAIPHGVKEVPAAAMGAGDLMDLGSEALLDGMDNYHPSAENAQSEPFSDSDWDELEKFWMNQMEGQGQEQQGLVPLDLLLVDGIAPDELLQEDEAWNQALQPANPANVVNNTPIAEEPATGDALVYDLANQSGVADNVFWVWSPQFAGDDYGMPF
ncbi:unnamed protein product [Triticum turgidum subsp. durum]|uniref:Uncharacterized protein n=1 Tax=Triticum turgidum subsp. durum TaxID=4567 RepID=A0A9R1BRZ9_TRITD|nr:unnamed protein product [Triticum turgidum subsp. durum]